jgi:hypothetical protein
MNQTLTSGSRTLLFTTMERPRGGWIAYLVEQPRIGVLESDESTARRELQLAANRWMALLDEEDAF